ncbi:hypothetical protein [Pseudodesulfovibrio sp.]|uniref:hypothetical protein n=1 Tax=unclassified Pseudodesulfovibrio TaxID=2661612 RepID=UPI003AFFED5A
MKAATLSVILVVILAHVALAGEPDVITYPQPLSAGDTRFEYHLSLVRKALERTVPEYGPFELRPTHLAMNQLRQLDLLENGSPMLDIAIKPTSREREQRLTPVRIPLGKGVVGWRILLVRRDLQHGLAKVMDKEGLKPFRFGQGLGWSDIGILRHNGLKVITGGDYEGLFAMLLSNRFEVFPRSIVEAFAEWDERHAKFPELHVETTLLLHYPFARYVWTANSKRGALLRERIAKGLESMIADGTFDAMFRKHYQETILRARLNQRRLIELENPDLPPETPLQRKELWFDPFKELPESTKGRNKEKISSGPVRDSSAGNTAP